MKAWLPTLSISIAAFIFVTSEFIPVGLISEIAHGFGRTESATGIMMTIYAWLVAVLSIPLTAWVSNINRRTLMLSLIAIFTLAHVISATATSFEMLIFSRIFVAIAHAIYWSIAIPLGIRLAPPGKRDQAMVIVSYGANIGSILGIPVGTLLGQLFGWRLAFAAIGLFAALVGLVLWRILPPTTSQNAGDFKSIGKLFSRPKLVLVYVITVLAMTGHYTAFTFISPFVEFIGGLPHDRIASVLLTYGVAGLIAGFFAPRVVSKHVRSTSFISLAVICAALVILRSISSNFAGLLTLTFIWGLGSLLFNLILQNLVLYLAPDAEDVAMAGYSGIYNIGIGGGALLGSIFSVSNLGSLGFIGASFVFTSLLCTAYLLKDGFARKLIVKHAGV